MCRIVRLRSFAAFVFLTAASINSGKALADSCSSLILQQIQKLQEARNRGVEFPAAPIQITIIQSNQTVSYAEGSIHNWTTNTLDGSQGGLTQYFNDRRDNNFRPFEKNRTDQLGVVMTAGDPSRFEIVGITWNFRASYSIRCEGPFIIGQAPGHRLIATFR